VKIYTKTGDSGQTSLIGHTRVSKADARVDAYGEVDEVNACLGAARAAGVDGEISSLIESLQVDLFAVGGTARGSGVAACRTRREASITEAHVERLEQRSISWNRPCLPCSGSSCRADRRPVRSCTCRAPSAGAPSGA